MESQQNLDRGVKIKLTLSDEYIKMQRITEDIQEHKTVWLMDCNLECCIIDGYALSQEESDAGVFTDKKTIQAFIIHALESVVLWDNRAVYEYEKIEIISNDS